MRRSARLAAVTALLLVGMAAVAPAASVDPVFPPLPAGSHDYTTLHITNSLCEGTLVNGRPPGSDGA